VITFLNYHLNTTANVSNSLQSSGIAADVIRYSPASLRLLRQHIRLAAYKPTRYQDMKTLGQLSAYEPLVTFEQEQQKLEPYGVVWVNSDPLDLSGGLWGGRRHPPSVPRHLRGHRGTRARRRACPIYALTSA